MRAWMTTNTRGSLGCDQCWSVYCGASINFCRVVVNLVMDELLHNNL
jgi:hypothetical protein